MEMTTMLPSSDNSSSDDLTTINQALLALRDHFEKQGKIFFVGWALIDRERDECCEYDIEDNVFSTTCLTDDFARVSMAWATRLGACYKNGFMEQDCE